MKERPILFSGPMVRAIREGRKTQTRRAIKFQWCGSREKLMHQATFDPAYKCPYGQPGDRLLVRETWAQDDRGGVDDNGRAAVYYRADMPSNKVWSGSWKPSIHMPRWASRITLEIVDMQAERLWNISEEDAKAEGCEWSQWSFPNSTKPVKSAYRALWESINGPGSWDLNQRVWVIEFREVKP